MFFIRQEKRFDFNSYEKMTALDFKKYILKVCLWEREKILFPTVLRQSYLPYFTVYIFVRGYRDRIFKLLTSPIIDSRNQFC
jgi:hypothetical protein